MAARRFFKRAIDTTKVTPSEVVTDRAPTYPLVLEELLPAAWHRTAGPPTTGSRPTTADSRRGCGRCVASSKTAAPGS
jgi:transposase-like protein